MVNIGRLDQDGAGGQVAPLPRGINHNHWLKLSPHEVHHIVLAATQAGAHRMSGQQPWWRHGKICGFVPIVALSFFIVGCATNEPSEGSAAAVARNSVYPISARQAYEVLRRSIHQSFAGSRITRLGRPRIGFTATLHIALDRHYITAVMEPAMGKDAKGKSVAGVLFRVYDRGTILISGPIRARKLRERIHRQARLIAAPLQYAGPITRSAPSRRGRRSSGSGFVINRHGDVLTNNHVADGCRNIWVRVGGVAYPGVLRAKDKANDLAVVRIAELPVNSVARFSGGSMKLGSSVVVLGYPLTSLLGDDLKATTGNVSGLSGLRNNSAYFQFTAPIQPGNSGGPIVDSTGAVAGVAAAKLREINVARRMGTFSQLVNFGVKSRAARGFLGTHNIPFSIARSNRVLPNVAIVSAAKKYTIRILCEE